MIGAITDHDAQGYWGLANIASDPETGEMIAGRGAVWQTITDYYASATVDLVRVLNGEIPPDDIADGANLVEAMQQIGNGNSGRTPSSEALDDPFRQPNALQRLANVRTGLDRLRLPDAGWLRPELNMPMFSRDPANPGALDRSAQRLLQGRIMGDGTALA
jgi:hypothetical protein